MAASLAAFAVVVGCTADPELARLAGVYQTDDGKHLLVLRADETGAIRLDGKLPGELGAACEEGDTCRGGVCRSAVKSDPALAAYSCQCPPSAVVDAGRRSVLPTECYAYQAAVAPAPLAIQADAFGRAQLLLTEASALVPGELLCWGCRLDDSGERLECPHAHPHPNEVLPAICSFQRIGRVEGDGGLTIERTVDAGSRRDASSDASRDGASGASDAGDAGGSLCTSEEDCPDGSWCPPPRAGSPLRFCEAT